MDRSREAGVLLACLALALAVLAALAINVTRVGAAISREVQRVQIDYLQKTGAGEPSEVSALRLGQCLRREMLKSARAGFVHPDTWAVAARVEALPGCSNGLTASARSLPAAVPRAPLLRAAAPVVPTTARAAYADNDGH